MKEIDDAPTAGAGYSEEGIDNASGVARTSTAAIGYDPADGTYTAPKKKYTQARFTPLPTNTGDRVLDELHAQRNRLDAKLFTDPKLASLIKMYDERYGGHGLGEYRGDMDDYMLHEFGRSKYDEGATNILTSEDAKRNRAENQSAFIVAANGGSKFAVRGIGTAAAGIVGIVDALTSSIQNTAGVSLKDYGWDAEGVANKTEAAIESIDSGIPIYQSQEDEQYAQENPWAGAFTTRRGWANFIDNLGFTAGAAITAALISRLGPAVSTGIGAATATKTIQDYLATDGDMTANDLLPLATGVAGAVLAKTLPMSSALKTQLATLAASITASFGEGEIEAVHAKNDFISEKSAIIDGEIERRKTLIMQKMRDDLLQEKKDSLKELVEEGKMSESDALMEALRLTREAMSTQEWQDYAANQMTSLEWEGLRVKNRITSEAESVADLTRLLNVGLLSMSNMVQFGKVFNGGYKTYRTMRGMTASKSAKEAADTAYRDALSKAGTRAARKAVKALRGAIRLEGMRRWADRTEGKIFDQSKGLTRGDWFDILIKSPAAEGLEEVGQSMISAGAMGASEWDVDDYYSQISGVEAYRKADAAWKAGLKAAVGKLGQSETWVEFASGALTGALGMPGIRSPFRRDAAATAPKDEKEAARRFRLRNLRSPIFFRGGVYGEWKKAKSDREAMARMAERLNEALTDKQVESFRKQLGHIARHMQYEDDKRMWADGEGDKFNFENAVDADLLNQIELFQDSGNMKLLYAMVQSQKDVKSTEDLLALQALTNEDDGKGGEAGPYSEFKITNLGPNATEEQRKASAEQEELMRKKIARDADRVLKAVKTYEKARKELDFETNQGLSDAQLNCLTWYKVRQSMFDGRSKEMFADIEKDIDTLSGNFNEIYDAIISGADNELHDLEQSVKGKEDQELVLPNGVKTTNGKFFEALKRDREKTVECLDAARDAIREAQSLSDAKDKIHALFEAQETLLSIPSEKQMRRVVRIAAKRAGLNHIANLLLNSDAQSTGVGSVLTRLFSDEARRKDIARKIVDIGNAQDALARYDALYRHYKNNPGLMAQRAAEHEEEMRQEAAAVEKAEAKEGLSACKTKAELYATIEKMIDDGKDEDAINAAIDELIKSGSALAKEFYENQKYVRYFANALTRVVDNRVGFTKDTDAKKRSLIHLILQQLMLDAAASVSGCKAMREHVMAQINGELSTPEGFIAYLTRNGLLEKKDSMTLEELNEVMNIFLLDDKGKPVPDRKMPNGRTVNKSVAKTKFSMLHDALPALFNAANNVLLRDAKRRMSLNLPNVEVNDFDLMTLRGAVNRNYTPYDNKAYDKVEKTARIGSEATFDNGKGADEAEVPEEKPDDNEEESVERRKVDDKDIVKFEDADKTPIEELNEENSNIGEGVVGEPVSVDLTKGEVTNGSKDDGGAAKRLLNQNGDKDKTSNVEWRPAMSYFNIELRKAGNFVKNLLVSLFGGAHIAKSGEKRTFEKFFNMLEKLGAFRFMDDTPNAVTVGEPVYFVVDKMKGDKSEIFGLSKDDIAYEGAPIVFMCVKRNNGYQCVGTMHTSKSALEKNGQLDFYNAVVEKAKHSEGAYVHKDANGDAITMPVKKVMPGFVQTSDSEHTILDVVGGKENVDKAVFAIFTGNGVCFGNMGDVRHMKETSLLEGKKDMAAGRLHLLVKDNATGQYRPMPCRIARFGKDDEAMYQRTDIANTIDEIVEQMSKLANQYGEAILLGKSADKIIKSFNQEYKRLSNILAMKGYGLHMDLIIKDGVPNIRFSQIVYKDGQPVRLDRTSKLKTEIIKWSDTGKNYFSTKIKNEYDQSTQYLRRFIDVRVKPEAVIDVLKSFNLQFRTRLKNGFVNKDDLSALVGQGLITTNIEPGCGLHTYGTSIVVDAFSVENAEPVETKPKDIDSVSLHGDERIVTILGEQFRLFDGKIFDADGRQITHAPTIRGIRAYLDTPKELRVVDLSASTDLSECDVYCLWSMENKAKAGVRCRAYRSGNGHLEFDMVDNEKMTETQYINLDMLQTSNDFINLMTVNDINGLIAANSLKLRKQGSYSEVYELVDKILSYLTNLDYSDEGKINSLLAQISDAQDKATFETCCRIFKNWLYCLRKADEENACKLIIKILSKFHSHDEVATLERTLRKNIWHNDELGFADSAESESGLDVAEAVAAEDEAESVESAEENIAPGNETEGKTTTEEASVEVTEEDVTENAKEDVVADVSEDAVVDATEDVAEDTTENAIEDAVENVKEGSVEEAAEEAAEEATEDAASDNEEDIDNEDIAKESAEVAQEDATKGVVEEAAEDAAEEDAAENTNAPVANKKEAVAAEDGTEDVSENITDDAKDAAALDDVTNEATAKKEQSEDEEMEAMRAELLRRSGELRAKALRGKELFTKNTTFRIENYTDRFTFSIRRKEDKAKPKIDINKELAVIRKLLPWLERENAILVYDHLITVAQNGMKAQGVYTHGIVSLSHEACRGTGFHEAFHAVFRTSLTDEKRREIYDAMRRDHGFENPIEAEEFLADEFAKFMVDRVYGTSLIKRVKDFFVHLWCVIRGGRRSRIIMDNLFHEINDGGFATRDIEYEHHIVERRKWWLRVAHKDKDWILNREDYLTSFAARPPHVQSMLEEAGWTEDSFDRLTQEQRENAIRCL